MLKVNFCKTTTQFWMCPKNHWSQAAGLVVLKSLKSFGFSIIYDQIETKILPDSHIHCICSEKCTFCNTAFSIICFDLSRHWETKKCLHNNKKFIQQFWLAMANALESRPLAMAIYVNLCC